MFDVDKIMKDLNKEMVNSVNSDLENKLRRMRCSIHGKAPRLLSKLKKLENTNLQIECCCDEFKALVLKGFN